jgi:cytochrome c oxidase subunit 4
MSTHSTAAAAAAAHEGQNGHITVKTLLVIYGALIGLMFLTFGAAKVDLGAANFLVAMSIALVKMVLIVLYFMHVRYSPKLTWVASMATFLWFLFLIGGLLNDYFTRGAINIPGK